MNIHDMNLVRIFINAFHRLASNEKHYAPTRGSKKASYTKNDGYFINKKIRNRRRRKLAKISQRKNRG